MGSGRDDSERQESGLRDDIGSMGDVDTVFQRLEQSSTFRMKRRESLLVESYRQREQKKLVSVIMPTWNRARVIQRAIDSVLNQSYRNYELIISDDGSTDGTCDFIRSKYGNVSRLFLIGNAHRGVCRARNSALAKAAGQLMAYLDSDNEWDPNYLMVMANALEDSPEKSCAYCGLRIVNENNGSQFTRLIGYNRSRLVERNYIDMNIFIHRRDLYQKYGGFVPNLEPLEDWELILRYTREKSPLVVECCLAKYHISRELNHQSLVCEAGSSYRKIRELYPN